MKHLMGTAAHPSDGDLVRYLDAELTELPERRLRAHLEACERCAGRVAALAAESRAVSRYLTATAVAGPDEVTRARALATARRASASREANRRGSLRMVAAATVVLALVLAGGPVRAWVMDGWPGLGSASDAPDAVVTLPAAVVHRSSVVAFTPRGESFELEIERFQPAGSLTVQFGESDRASAQIENGAEETMLVLPAGLRVENARGSRASYQVVVPSGVGSVRVSVGGQLVDVLRSGSEAGGRTYSLVESAATR